MTIEDAGGARRGLYNGLSIPTTIRKVFFSFHYADIMAVNIVRNSDVITKKYTKAARYHDRSLWEEAETKGPAALKKMIEDGLQGSSVTCVLIGQNTYHRPWVRYEILRSFQRGNGLLGINIHDVGMNALQIAPGMLHNGPGPNPFAALGFTTNAATGAFNLLEWTGDVWRSHPHITDGPLGAAQSHVGGLSSGRFDQLFPIYNWKSDNGHASFSAWVEAAAKGAGR